MAMIFFSDEDRVGRRSVKVLNTIQEREPAGRARLKPVRIHTVAIEFWKT